MRLLCYIRLHFFYCSRKVARYLCRKSMNRITALVMGNCPNCEKGKIYTDKLGLTYAKIRERCPHCAHKFDKEPGFFFGAMYVSYTLSIAAGVGAYILCRFFFASSLDMWMIPFVLGTIFILTGFNYNYSRIIWIYLFTKKGKSLTQVNQNQVQATES